MEFMNDIQMFYLNDASNGRPTYDQVMAATPEWIEGTHDWVQRAFPNFEPSEIVSDAPVLDEFTLIILKDSHVQARIYSLVFKYLNHYAHISDESRLPHNNRRVTRLIKFLIMLGYEDAAKTVFMTCRSLLYEWNNETILPFDISTAIMYWREALTYKRENNE
jgi:hypothetical protein